MMHFLPIISLLFIGDNGQPMLAEHRADNFFMDNQSLRCHNCPANNPSCLDTCIGRYCYKAEFIADGYTTVKRGCLNQTDSGIRVGICDEIPSDLPGSDFPAIDRMCVCTSDKCNISSTTDSTIINLSNLSIVTLFIFYILRLQMFISFD